MARVSNVHAAFPASAIADRVVAAVTTLPVRTLLKMTDENLLVISKRDPAPYQTLSYRNMKWQYLDEYAAATGATLSYFIFGENIPSKTEYSYFDSEVSAILQIMPPDALKAAKHIIHTTFYNSCMQIGHISAPSKIISLALLNARPPELVPEEELSKYRMNINEALLYYRKTRIKERCMLNIDYVPDLCAYFKVSPHWAFSLRGPLLFTNAEADAFFDHFCFLSRYEQVIVLSMLLSLYPEAETILAPEMLRRIRHVIATEGGVVL